MIRNTPSPGSPTAVALVQISTPFCKGVIQMVILIELMVTWSTQTDGIPTVLLSIGETSEAKSLLTAKIAQGGIYAQ